MKVKLVCPHVSLLLAAIILFGLSSCTSNSSVQLQDDLVETPELASESADMPTAEVIEIEYPVRAFSEKGLYELLVAEVAGYRGQYKIALSKYMEQAKATQDAGVAARATRLANYLKDHRSIFQASKIWVQADQDNLEARRYLVDQLIRQRDYVQAMSQMKEIKRLGGDAHFDIFAFRIASMDIEGRHSLLTSVVEMLDHFPNDKDLRFTQAALLEQTGEPEKALEIVDLLLVEEGRVNLVILKVNLLRTLDRDTDVMDFLDAQVEIGTDSRRIRAMYARQLFEVDRRQEAKLQYQLLLGDNPEDDEVLFALALIAMHEDDDQIARKYLNRMIRLNARRDEAYYYLGSLAEKAGDNMTAIREYGKVKKGYNFISAQARIASLISGKAGLSEARIFLGQSRVANPGAEGPLVLLEAQLLSEASEEDELFGFLDSQLALDPDNLGLLYFRAMSGQKFGSLEILERDLQKVIQLDPGNADAMNALGYTLADQTDRHEEAYSLIAKALTIKPEEAAFLDSMGWVLYRLDRLSEAIDYLQRAYQLFPNDEVAAHLGEVLWKDGQRFRAKKVWKKALELAPESPFLVNILERISGE
jgi:tetratricopeptide (TPR) repeat protein